jgi:hypothetical protein
LSGSYNPATIRTGSGTDNFSVRVMPASYSTTVQRAWDISEAVLGGNGLVTVTNQWNSGEQGASFDRSLAEGWLDTGSGWVKQAGSLTSITAQPTYPAVATFRTTIFSKWTIGNNAGPLPIQLAWFTGHLVGGNSVQLEWTTLSELNNYGFFVQRRATGAGSFEQLDNSFIPGHGTTLDPQYYTYTNESVTAGRWEYRLRQVDLDGTDHFTDPIQVDVLTSVNEESQVLTYALHQNYPNPFNPTTTIEYAVPANGHVTVKVYSMTGQEVATLVDGEQQAGVHSLHWDASRVSSGTYMYMLQAGNVRQARMLMLVK